MSDATQSPVLQSPYLLRLASLSEANKSKGSSCITACCNCSTPCGFSCAPRKRQVTKCTMQTNSRKSNFPSCDLAKGPPLNFEMSFGCQANEVAFNCTGFPKRKRFSQKHHFSKARVTGSRIRLALNLPGQRSAALFGDPSVIVPATARPHLLGQSHLDPNQSC